MKYKKHTNILPYPEKYGENVSTFDFICRGCTMRNREEKWAEYASSIYMTYNQEIDNSYLTFEEEPDNPYDPNAIQVVVRGEIFGTAGYVGREYTGKVKKILAKCSLYRIDMRDLDDCGKREIPLVMSYVCC
jgi:hypothetical protein